MSAECVAAMEDVLDLDEEPYDPTRPTVNVAATSTQLMAATRVPLPPTPGKATYDDYAYRRNGTRNLLMFCEPQAGWRPIAITTQRTMRDFAEPMRWVVDERYPEAEGIRVVWDNLTTHQPAALDEAFAPAEARRMLKKLAWHDTPKHGSWLHMAEIE